jgi:hypothetical protein
MFKRNMKMKMKMKMKYISLLILFLLFIFGIFIIFIKNNIEGFISNDKYPIYTRVHDYLIDGELIKNHF